MELDDGWPLGDPLYSSAVVSFAETLGRFLNAHGCGARTVIRDFFDTDGNAIFVREMTVCPQTEVVQACVIVEGGYRWHGIGDNSDDRIRECDVVNTGSFTLNTYVFVGSTTLDGFIATRSAWRFFRAL